MPSHADTQGTSPDVLPIHGRDEVLELLGDLLSGRRRTGSGVVVTGEAGMGKSAVWDRGLEMGRRAGRAVLSTRCVEGESGMPYAALDDLLGPVLDRYGSGLHDAHRQALEGALLRGTPTDVPGARTVAAAVRALLRRMCDDGPLLVAVDDLGWMDAESQSALAYALRRLTDAPVAVLAALRSTSPLDDDGEAVTAGPLASYLDSAVRIRLDPLGPSAAQQLLDDRLGVRISLEDARRWCADTGGNPFWAIELARGARSVPPGSGGPPIALRPAADRLARLVETRIDGLAPLVVRTAALVGVLGRPPVDTVLAALVEPGDLDPGRTEAVREGTGVLDEAVTAGLLSVTQGRLHTSHPLIATALRAVLPPFEQRRLHLLAGRLTSSPEERAEQLLRAHEIAVHGPGTEPDLVAALDEATDAAERRGAPAAAGRYALRALDALETAGAGTTITPARRIRAAQLQFFDGEAATAAVLLERLDLGALSPDLLDDAAPLMVDAAFLHDGVEAARRVVEELAALPVTGDRRVPALLATLCADLRFTDPDRHAHAEYALEETAVAGSTPAVRRRALTAAVYDRLDRRGEVDEAVLEARAELEGSSPTRPVQHGLDILTARVLAAADRPEEACRLFDRCVERARLLGDDVGLVSATVSATYQHRLLGRPQRAERLLAGLSGQIDWRRPEPAELVYARSLLPLADGNWAAVELLLSAHQHAVDDLTGLFGYMRGLLALRRGDTAVAVERLVAFTEHATALGVVEPSRRLDADWDLVDALVRAGDLDAATARLDTLGGVRRTRSATRTGQELRGRAAVALAAGAHDHALATAHLAVARHELSPRPAELGRSLLTLSRVMSASGDRSGASHAGDRARAVFLDAGELWWAEQAGSTATPRGEPSVLTLAERAVADLVAGGATNKEVATELHLSVSTVQNHLSSTYRKLGIRSRTQLRRGAG